MNNIDTNNLSYEELLQISKITNEFINFLEKEKDTIDNE